MSKTKKLLITLMLLIAVLLIPNMVNATVEYTRIISGNDGSITLNLTGLDLDTTKQHEFALVISGGTPSTWHTITEKTQTTATIEFNSSTADILEVLKAGNTGYLYLREKDNTTEYEVENKEIDLKLPYLNAVNISKTSTDGYQVTTLYGYDNDATSFKWEKITDTAVIEKYLAYKNNGTEISASDLKQTIPTTGFSTNWGFVASAGNYCTIFESGIPDDGLYYLWIKSSDDNCKIIYGYMLHDGLPNATTVQDYVGVINGAPTVENIVAKGDSSNLTTIPGTVNLEYQPTVGDEIKVNIKFDQNIVKNSAPKLTIKFGTGSNIELTTCEAASDTLTYKYTIKEGDLGTLQIVSFTGGNVTNNEGTAAVLTLPELSGTKVVAIESDEPQQEPVDTTKYISFPFIIFNGKGSVDLYSGVNVDNYTMYYQFVEISDEVYNQITDLQDKYKNSEITYEEYFTQYNAAITKYNDNNWIETEDGSFEQDLNKFTGTKKFALWVKLEMADKTVYESQIYTMDGSGTATNEPDVTQKPTTTDKDTTVADKDLPDTGKVLLIWIIGIVAVSGIVAHIRYKKLYM